MDFYFFIFMNGFNCCPLLYNGQDNKILDLLFCLFGFRMFGKELTMYGIVLHFLSGLIQRHYSGLSASFGVGGDLI